MSGYEIAGLTEVKPVKATGTLRWTPLRKHFGITAFGISASTASAAGMQAGLAEKPDHAGLHFHLACIFARAGRLDEARSALDRALELDPKLQKWADEDEDLEPLRASDAMKR